MPSLKEKPPIYLETTLVGVLLFKFDSFGNDYQYLLNIDGLMRVFNIEEFHKLTFFDMTLNLIR
jgi:hypothetical protein